MKRVYIAGPYSKGDREANVRAAIDAAHELIELGFAPYVPHLNHYIHLLHPQDYDTWMDQDEIWLRQCEILLRLPGPSDGSDKEVPLARCLNMPVYFTIGALYEGEQS
jgi:hypothetical protein